MFTDWYGQQSCTAGRAAFITGQSPVRTGQPQGRFARSAGSRPQGRDDPTLAGLLKSTRVHDRAVR